MISKQKTNLFLLLLKIMLSDRITPLDNQKDDGHSEHAEKGAGA